MSTVPHVVTLYNPNYDIDYTPRTMMVIRRKVDPFTLGVILAEAALLLQLWSVDGDQPPTSFLRAAHVISRFDAVFVGKYIRLIFMSDLNANQSSST